MDQKSSTSGAGRGNSKRSRSLGALLAIILLGVVVYFTMGIFVIQPIGACPEGRTIIYWRYDTNLPFISSADGLLLDRGEGVSLLGRGIVMAAVGEAIEDKIIVRLPYMRFLYLWSTGGKEFER